MTACFQTERCDTHTHTEAVQTVTCDTVMEVETMDTESVRLMAARDELVPTLWSPCSTY